jgi:hypothetical protein
MLCTVHAFCIFFLVLRCIVHPTSVHWGRRQRLPGHPQHVRTALHSLINPLALY